MIEEVFVVSFEPVSNSTRKLIELKEVMSGKAEIRVPSSPSGRNLVLKTGVPSPALPT
jgi:hypothetical protein